MALPKTLAFLELLMRGDVPDESDIDNLLMPWVAEDLYLDYKHGNELKKANAAQTVRQYVSAFANSAGGVLVVGVDEDNHRVVGASAPGGGDLARWASTCLTPVAAYLAPPPRIAAVQHRDGTVLALAVNRNPLLVPVVEAGEVTYHLRVHDQTLKAPAYLVTDLLLGRRERPDLAVADATVTVTITGAPTNEQRVMVLSPQIQIENRGLSQVNGVAAGILGWTIDDRKRPHGTQILSYLEIVEPADEWLPRRIGHGRWPTHDLHGVSLPALHLLGLKERLDFVVPWVEHDYRCLMALYIVAEHLPVTWYQFECTVPHHSFVLPMGAPTPLAAKVEWVSGTRPVVAWEGL